MSSWPPSLADWGELTPRLRDGATVCVVHGLVDAQQVPLGIPVCPHCRQAVLLARRDREGVLREFAGPRPARCPRGHQLDGGRVLLGWKSCNCSYASPGPGGHRTWRCQSCAIAGPAGAAAAGGDWETDLIRWPPCADPAG